MVNVTLKDGTSKAYAKGTTILEIAKDLSEGLARNACCGKIDGEVADLRDAVERIVQLKFVLLTLQRVKRLTDIQHLTLWLRL
mgnify:CR=1 FL=1